MFNLTSGYVVKDYDETSDRLVFTAYGDVAVSSIKMEVGTSSINSKDYELAIQSNMTVEVQSGTISIAQDVAFLPGSQIIINQGVTCTLASGVNVYVYDADQWGAYAFGGYDFSTNNANFKFIPVVYAPGRTYTRTDADLVDAEIDVNGTIDASAGYLYTTTGGANVYSSAGTGKIIMQPGTQTTTYQATQSSSTVSYVDISITSAHSVS